METFKKSIISSLGEHATTVLIDSNFGPNLISNFPKNCSPMMAYEADVYHISDTDRITKLPENISISDFAPDVIYLLSDPTVTRLKPFSIIF